MKKVEIEAFDDTSRPQGGHVVVVVCGVTRLPEKLTVQLRPLEGGLTAGLEDGWPTGDRSPLEASLTAHGIKLVLGPEIADCKALLPGLALEITIPALSVRGELLWPVVTPLTRPKRRSIKTARPAFEPIARQVGAAEAAERRAETLPTPVQSPVVNSPPSESAQPEAAKPDDSGPAAPAPVSGQSTSTAPQSTSAPRDDDDRLYKFGPIEQPPPDDDNDQDQDGKMPQPAAARAASAAAIDTRGRHSAWLGYLGAFVGGLVTAHLALVALSAGNTLAPREVQSASTRLNELARGERSMFDAMAAGKISPRGIAADGVTAVAALHKAQVQIDAGADRDPAELAFWLKSYLASTIGQEHIRRALSQLGSTYAAPKAGAADHVTARLIWEIASAYGDPVAMCFVGMVHEHGLGVPVDKRLAAQWYQRSKAIGGCAAVDEALARVKG